MLNGSAHVRGSEEGGAGYDGIGTGPQDVGQGAGVDAAIDFDVVGEAVLVTPCAGGADLVEGFRNQILATEAGLNGHDEEEVDLAEPWFCGGEGGVAIDGEAAAETGGPDAPQGFADIVLSFHVYSDLVRAGFDEPFEVVVRAFDHEVDIEEDVVGAVNCGDELGTERDIVDEVAVHDIEVEPIGSGADGA